MIPSIEVSSSATMTTLAAPSVRANLHPYFKIRSRSSHSSHSSRSSVPPQSWSVPGLCAAYGWPRRMPGGGVIAIVELGGGWVAEDLAAFFSGQPLPSVVDISVDGTKNSPGQDADGEVALDIQVAGASYFAATGRPAEIRVYWSSDIASAVRAATADGCDVCSISWGADEATWGKEEALDLEAALAQAAQAGMVVFAAAGDNDSSDGGPKPANVDLPAGAPHAIGCGGTTKTATSEQVWNDAPGQTTGDGTGGGYSTIFPVPTWQAGRIPAGPAGLGRMVPDVSACADPGTGYEIVLHGEREVVGGTSAVAPLYAGLVASAGKKLGFLGDRLWSNPQCFVDVVRGDNGMYRAAPGPDACTGLGVPVGQDVANICASGAISSDAAADSAG